MQPEDYCWLQPFRPKGVGGMADEARGLGETVGGAAVESGLPSLDGRRHRPGTPAPLPMPIVSSRGQRSVSVPAPALVLVSLVSMVVGVVARPRCCLVTVLKSTQ